MKAKNKKKYLVVVVNDRHHVVCEAENRDGIKNSDYLGFNLALCGVLRKGETLESWEYRRLLAIAKASKSKRNKNGKSRA